jgi:hypothetical protein
MPARRADRSDEGRAVHRRRAKPVGSAVTARADVRAADLASIVAELPKAPPGGVGAAESGSQRGSPPDGQGAVTYLDIDRRTRELCAGPEDRRTGGEFNEAMAMKLVAITADCSADSACALGIVSIEKGKITSLGW